ncbi:unnamed protein product, partial [Ectocarpus sp. 8 AP-2014]
AIPPPVAHDSSAGHTILVGALPLCLVSEFSVLTATSVMSDRGSPCRCRRPSLHKSRQPCLWKREPPPRLQQPRLLMPSRLPAESGTWRSCSSCGTDSTRTTTSATRWSSALGSSLTPVPFCRQTVIGLVYLIPMWASGMQKVPKLTKEDVIKLLPISVLHAGGHLAAVLSMSAGAVSFTHIIKASEPVASTVIGPFFGVEVQPMTVNMFLLPIVGGVAYAAMKPGQGLDMSQLTNLASGYAMASNIFFAIRGILSKQV